MDDFELSAGTAAGLEAAGRPDGGGLAEPMTYREKRAAEAALREDGGGDGRPGRGDARPEHTRSRIGRPEAGMAGPRGDARSTATARGGFAPQPASPDARAADAAFRRQRAAAEAAAWRGQAGAWPDAAGAAWQSRAAHAAGRGDITGAAGRFAPNAPPAPPHPQAVRPAGRRWGTLPPPMHRPGGAAAAPGWPAGAYSPAGPAGHWPGPHDAASAAWRGGMPPAPWQGAPYAASRGYAPSPRDAWRPVPGVDAGLAAGEGQARRSPPLADAVPPTGPADRAAAARDAFSAARPSPADAQRQTERVRAYAAKQDHARTELPDYDRVVGAARIPVSHALAEALVESEHTARLEYHLARSPEKLAELNRLPPRDAARAVGRLEAEIAGAAAPRPTRAPAPLTPLRGGAAGPMRSLAELATSEDAAGYIELRRAQRRA